VADGHGINDNPEEAKRPDSGLSRSNEETHMAEIKLKNGQAYCKKCGRDVAVREEKGDASREQKPLILVDDQGHIIAERYTTAGAWNRAS
jgi:hypothetical protein